MNMSKGQLSDISNKIFVGDCKEILPLFPEKCIAACITDPPYNYEFIGHKWDHKEINRRLKRVQDGTTLVKNIPYGSGLAGGVRNKRWYEKVRKSILEYEDWCYEWGKELFRVCKPGAVIAAFNSTRSFAHLQVALERAGFYARDCIVYRRSTGIPKGLNVEKKMKQKEIPDYRRWKGWHSCLRNEWEAIVVLQKPLENNYIETLLKYDVGVFHAKKEGGVFQSNILENISKDEDFENTVHCTVKPLALIEKLVELFVPKSDRNIILDPFAGSGTTLVAAKKLNRKFVGIEIVPEYLDIINNRLAGIKKDKSKKANEQYYAYELFPRDNF